MRVINFVRNQGQTPAMMAGFDHTVGDVIIPMDADMQNDPADITKLLNKMDEGFTVVSGWRKDRKDKWLSRVFPSQVANWIISRISGVPLHDYGCTLKAYRRDTISQMHLYSERHRFIPIYAHWYGGRVAEVQVNHRPRAFGVSHYGLGRLFKVVLDLVVIKCLDDQHAKPIYLFGAVSLFCFALSLITGGLAIWLKIFNDISFILTPLPLFSAFAFMTGLLCFLIGLLAEILLRIYFESQGKPVYLIRDKINFTDPD